MNKQELENLVQSLEEELLSTKFESELNSEFLRRAESALEYKEKELEKAYRIIGEYRCLEDVSYD